MKLGGVWIAYRDGLLVGGQGVRGYGCYTGV